MKNYLNEIKFSNFVWIHSSSIDKKAAEEIGRRFKLHPDDLKEVLPPIQRPKLVERDNYFFMILMYPFYNKETRLIEISEVDFFIARDFVVTFNGGNKLEPIGNFIETCSGNELLCEKIIASGPAGLLYELLDRLSNFCFPMLVHISNDIDAVEKRLFKEYEKGTIFEILRIKTNLANFSKAIQGHKTIVDKLINKEASYLPAKQLKIYFDNLVERKKEMWDMVDNLNNIINALHQTNESLISFRINEIMKTLTIFSVIVFPLTLLASIFGMNVVKDMPFMDSPCGFWAVIGIMVVGTLGMLGIFKMKKWL
jgi:magnesium transporter